MFYYYYYIYATNFFDQFYNRLHVSKKRDLKTEYDTLFTYDVFKIIAYFYYACVLFPLLSDG